MSGQAGAASEDADATAPENEPGAAELVGQALSAAALRAGIDPDAETSLGHTIWQVIGGWRGVAESTLPLLTFIVSYTTTQNLPLALGLSVGVAALFTLLRLLMKSPPVAALSGLIAAVFAASIPFFTGRAEDQFIVGFITNIAYGSAFLISALVRWPLIGVVAGFLNGERFAWREDARKRRVFFWLSLGWAGVFFARLGAQLPFYFSGDVATLGTVKLIMGVPLFATMLAVTWVVARRLYPRGADADDPVAA